jgi:hypothetical protein
MCLQALARRTERRRFRAAAKKDDFEIAAARLDTAVAGLSAAKRSRAAHPDRNSEYQKEIGPAVGQDRPTRIRRAARRPPANG